MDSNGKQKDAISGPLPECKIKRNYTCSRCPFYTQNPRTHLTHLRDVHNQKVKIYDCPQCLYASKHFQKLVRHVKMVHAEDKDIGDQNMELADMNEEEESIEQSFEKIPEISIPDDNSAPEDDLTCTVCGFKAPTRTKLGRHKKREHHFHRFFPCTKCNYVTHIRARFTKHVKYHNMPMIKCELCEFRTPYKWNLERHMKNHGGNGAYHCSECNFTADIKQSLTVHEMNHHLPKTLKPKYRKLAQRRKELLLALEASGINKDIIFSGTEAAQGKPTDESVMLTLSELEKLTKQTIPNNNGEQTAVEKVKKAPRPIPNLIPLQSTPTSIKPPTVLNIPNVVPSISIPEELPTEHASSDNLVEADNAFIDISALKPDIEDKSSFKKKNASFFDKLKEKLMTTSAEGGSLCCKDCGYTSKCLSEHSSHEKMCNMQESKAPIATSAGLGSTRCQHCRHRCKSSSDLILHIQSCPLAPKERLSPVNTTDKIEVPINPTAEEEASVDDPQEPHPMENVVFVWNSMLHQSNSVMYENSSFDLKNAIQFEDNISKPSILATGNSADAETNTDDGEGKKVFKCPQCSFWASTASRFHVHIVGHLNRKPFECSLCSYRSNWRWDITKHIRLKSVRDPSHSQAKVLMTDETGRRNYSKYNKYITTMKVPEASEDGKSTSGEPVASKPGSSETNTNDSAMEEMQESETATENELQSSDLQSTQSKPEEGDDIDKLKKPVWKCKKCPYKNLNKEALLDHFKKYASHNQFVEQETGEMSAEEEDDEEYPSDPNSGTFYSCGHCNQISNWKHVIQRHCRLKHNGEVKVSVVKKEDIVKDLKSENIYNLLKDFKCTRCPFMSQEKTEYENHVKQHSICPDSVYKCFICSFYVKSEAELIQHLQLHMDFRPSYMMAASEKKSAPSPPVHQSGETPVQVKRYKCSECPYESNSKSQFMYHEQFHKTGNDAPFKCEICNYQVTKRHLLHQHMKVHGIYKDASDIQQVWVNFEGDYQKMYKCRHCPYVQLRKNNIQDHEHMHVTKADENMLQCNICTYSCTNPDILFSHSKVHKTNYAKVVCPVNTSRSDDDQILEIKRMALFQECTKKTTEEKPHEVKKSSEPKVPVQKILCFCKYCPARFLYEKELNIHMRFHTIRLPYQCKVCSYTARQHPHLMAHYTVHTGDYQEKTKSLQAAHPTHEKYFQPKILLAVSGMNSDEPVWVVVMDCNSKENDNNKEKQIEKKEGKLHSDTPPTKTPLKHYDCKECPAKFFKSSALHYHQSLHGGNGQFKCKQCNYAVKTVGNLVKHEAVHNESNPDTATADQDSNSNEESFSKSIPLSGTDLFQHKTEVEKRISTEQLITRPNDHFPPVLQADPQFGLLMHGNPDFVYPTYLKNGRQKEKKYKCHKCPSAFEKREQYKIHLSLHGSKQRYKCEICDYSVKYYANYVQHMRKHQMNSDAQAARKSYDEPAMEVEAPTSGTEIPLAIKTIPRQPNKDFSRLSVSDQQTLKLLHRRKSTNSATKELTTEEKKLFLCSRCPYSNNRRDTVDNHFRRHDKRYYNSGNYECSYCKFSAPQAQFLKDHIKLHFNVQKYFSPELYSNFGELEIHAEFIENDKDTSENLIVYNEKMKYVSEDIVEDVEMTFVAPITGVKVEK